MKKVFDNTFWVDLRDTVPWLDLQGEYEDLNMLYDGLGSIIHDEGDPEPPSDWSCKETEHKVYITSPVA